MALTSRTNPSRTGRFVGDYFNQPTYTQLDEGDPLNVKSLVEQVEDFCVQLGFNSVYHVASLLAKSDIDSATSSSETDASPTQEFIATNGLSRLLENVGNVAFKSSKRVAQSFKNQLFLAATTQYELEWQNIANNAYFRKSLARFEPEYIERFSIADIYNEMQTNAPNFIQLLEDLTGQKNANNTSQADSEHNQRLIVAAVSILSNLRSRKINLLQGFVGFVLQAFKVPVRVMGILNHLGVSVSYSAIRRALTANGAAMLRQLHAVGSEDNAFYVSFDNMTFKAGIRDERLLNQAAFITATVGYIMKPHPDLARPMFRTTDAQYELVTDLTSPDFLPTDEDKDNLRKIFESLIWDIVKTAILTRSESQTSINEDDPAARPSLSKVSLENAFPMISIHPLDRTKKPTILCTPTYNHDEAKTDEVIEIDYAIARDIGLTDYQKTHCLIHYRGDHMTVQNNRYSPLLWITDNLADLLYSDSPSALLNSVWTTSIPSPVSSICI
jgi:hypothetical protein